MLMMKTKLRLSMIAMMTIINNDAGNVCGDSDNNNNDNDDDRK